MKTVNVPKQSKAVANLLRQAKKEDVIVRGPDGSEYLLSAVDDFDHELAATRRNQKLMELLDRRGKQDKVIPQAQVRRMLGLDTIAAKKRRG
jgi:hypothetical protein